MNHWMISFLTAIALTGCAQQTAYRSTPAYAEYSVEQIVRWSQAGQTPREIIDRLRRAEGFYPLTASELVGLHEQGVALEVLDYLQDTYLRTIRREERFEMPRRFSGRY